MAGQQRRVEVEGSVLQLEQFGRDDLPVVGEDQQLGLELLDVRERFRSAQARGRQDPLDPEFTGEAPARPSPAP